MLSKARIKIIQSLKLPKFRNQNELFVAEGSTSVLDFIKGGIQVDEIYASPEWLDKHSKRLKGIKQQEVNEKELKKISSLKNPSEVVCVFRMPDHQIPDLKNFDELALILDDIRDPGNLGTIIRTADWFGIKHIFCSTNTVDQFNPKVVQATMGSLGRVKIHYVDLDQLLKEKPDFIPVFGAVMHGDNITELPKPQRAFIVIGNESRGISDKIEKILDHKITIPQAGPGGKSSPESLNASIATAIICYEFRR